MPKVVNKRIDVIPPGTIRVDRLTKYGNPMTLREIKRLFPGISELEAHQKAVAWYREYLKSRPDLVACAKRELRGKDLWCWDAPLPCHADVLLEIANADATRPA